MSATPPDLAEAQRMLADLIALYPDAANGPYVGRAAILGYQNSDTHEKESILQAFVVLLSEGTAQEQSVCIEMGRSMVLPRHIVLQLVSTYEQQGTPSIGRVFAEATSMTVPEAERQRLHDLFVSDPVRHATLALVALRHRNDAVTWEAFTKMMAQADDAVQLKAAFDAALATQRLTDFYPLVADKPRPVLEQLLLRLPPKSREQVRRQANMIDEPPPSNPANIPRSRYRPSRRS